MSSNYWSAGTRVMVLPSRYDAEYAYVDGVVKEYDLRASDDLSSSREECLVTLKGGLEVWLPTSRLSTR